MPVHLKNGDIGGGSWITVADGKAFFNSGGAWISPDYIRLKNGDIGGGSWIDSGYRGEPTTPTGLAVNAWTYTSASVKWTAGAGGAAAASYEIQLLNSSGGVISTVTNTASPSSTFTLASDTKYQFRVRAKSASGLYSPYTANLRIQTGHASSTYTTTETGTRPWSSAASVNAIKDKIVGPVVPSSVHCTAIRYQISANAGFTSALSPWNNREIHPWLLNADGATFQWQVGSIDTTIPHSFIGNNAINGMICRGTGWTIYETGTARAVGTITASGTETYQYQQTHTNPAVANSYW